MRRSNAVNHCPNLRCALCPLHTLKACTPQRYAHTPSIYAGSINGKALQGRGVLLDHRAAASAIEEARQLARVRVQIRFIRDWVVDYSEPGAVWIISDWAWYRCAAIKSVRSLHCNAGGQEVIWQMSQNISQRAVHGDFRS